MKNRFFRRILVLAAATVLAVNPISAFAVTTVTRTADNDAVASSGNSNYNYGFVYTTASSHYNGDARISGSAYSGNIYEWIYPHPKSGAAFVKGDNVSIKVEAYLNHSTFKDPAAVYYVNTWQYTATFVKTLDQNKAAAGWNVLGTISQNRDGWLSEYVHMNPSGTVGLNTGADAIRVTYTW